MRLTEVSVKMGEGQVEVVNDCDVPKFGLIVEAKIRHGMAVLTFVDRYISGHHC
jgi:hypothetical protein